MIQLINNWISHKTLRCSWYFVWPVFWGGALLLLFLKMTGLYFIYVQNLLFFSLETDLALLFPKKYTLARGLRNCSGSVFAILKMSFHVGN